MKGLIDKAKEIIEMSVDPEADKGDYSLKANDWLKKFEAAQKTHKKDHDHKSEGSCSLCGYDLVCPSCGSD